MKHKKRPPSNATLVRWNLSLQKQTQVALQSVEEMRLAWLEEKAHKERIAKELSETYVAYHKLAALLHVTKPENIKNIISAAVDDALRKRTKRSKKMRKP